MAHLRDTSYSLPRFPRYRLASLLAVPLLILTVPLPSEASRDDAPSGTTAQAVPTLAAPVAGTTSAVTQPAVTQTAVVVTPAKPESDDQQRRVLLLLLMNSAGPVRPYGNLGR